MKNFFALALIGAALLFTSGCIKAQPSNAFIHVRGGFCIWPLSWNGHGSFLRQENTMSLKIAGYDVESYDFLIGDGKQPGTMSVKVRLINPPYPLEPCNSELPTKLDTLCARWRAWAFEQEERRTSE